MRRILWLALLGVGVAGFYLTADWLLRRAETSFGWCSISQPTELVPGRSATFGIQYHEVAGPLRLVCHLRWESADRRAGGFLWSSTPLPTLDGSGSCALDFSIPHDERINSAELRLFLSTTDDWKDRVNEIASGPVLPVRSERSGKDQLVGFPTRLQAAFQTALHGRWRQLRGDPTVLGWLITLAYWVVAGLGLRCALRLRVSDPQQPGERRVTRLWWGVAGLVLVLGINKQLDLQILVTDAGRELARASGWYWHRRAFQHQVILQSITIGLTALCLFSYWIRHHWRSCWLAVAGMSLLLLHVLLRAVSFHHMDELLGLWVGDVHVLSVLELGSVVLVGIAAHRTATAALPRQRGGLANTP